MPRSGEPGGRRAWSPQSGQASTKSHNLIHSSQRFLTARVAASPRRLVSHGSFASTSPTVLPRLGRGPRICPRSWRGSRSFGAVPSLSSASIPSHSWAAFRKPHRSPPFPLGSSVSTTSRQRGLPWSSTALSKESGPWTSPPHGWAPPQVRSPGLARPCARCRESICTVHIRGFVRSKSCEMHSRVHSTTTLCWKRATSASCARVRTSGRTSSTACSVRMQIIQGLRSASRKCRRRRVAISRSKRCRTPCSCSMDVRRRAKSSSSCFGLQSRSGGSSPAHAIRSSSWSAQLRSVGAWMLPSAVTMGCPSRLTTRGFPGSRHF